MVQTNGRCNYRTRTIEISAAVMQNASDKDILNVLMHEIAHGLNPWDGHGPKWKQTFLALGGNGKRCNSYEGVPYLTGKPKYILTCENRHFAYEYQRKPKTVNRLCKKCKSMGYAHSTLKVENK